MSGFGSPNGLETRSSSRSCTGSDTRDKTRELALANATCPHHVAFAMMLAGTRCPHSHRGQGSPMGALQFVTPADPIG